MDRRTFFTDSLVDELKTQFSKSQLGWLASKFVRKTDENDASPNDPNTPESHAKVQSLLETSKHRETLFRAGQPMDASGTTFTGTVTSIKAWVEQGLSGKAFVVIGKDNGLTVSILTKTLETEQWEHSINDPMNQQVPVGQVRGMLQTPWNTVLCGLEGGALELDPALGVIRPRLKLEAIKPILMHLVTTPGRPARLYIVHYHDRLESGDDRSGYQVLKLISTDCFQTKNSSANRNLLKTGTLYLGFCQNNEPLKWQELKEGPIPAVKGSVFELWPEFIVPRSLSDRYQAKQVLLGSALLDASAGNAVDLLF